MRRERTTTIEALFLLSAATLAAGCASNQLARASSGQIGCPEAEIQISNYSRGWHTVTWTARCRGETYYCSSARTGESSGQYQCRRNSDTSVVANSSSQSAAPVDATPKPAPAPTTLSSGQASFPDGALGFKFGTSVEESEAACVRNGSTWNRDDSAYRCSAPPIDIGVPAYVRLKFSDDGLSQLQVFVFLTPDEVGNRNFERLRNGLKEKYGAARKDEMNRPDSCGSAFLSCVLAQQASWKARWEWSDSQLIVATTSIIDGKPIVAVLYQEQKSVPSNVIKSEAF